MFFQLKSLHKIPFVSITVLVMYCVGSYSVGTIITYNKNPILISVTTHKQYSKSVVLVSGYFDLTLAVFSFSYFIKSILNTTIFSVFLGNLKRLVHSTVIYFKSFETHPFMAISTSLRTPECSNKSSCVASGSNTTL